MASYKDAENHRISRFWPAVAKWPVHVTSEATGLYNCFAYVVGDTKRLWSPLPMLPRGIYWPVVVKDEEEDTIWPIFRAYETVGFEECANGDFEDGVEKIAIYVDKSDCPTHVAIQRNEGLWQSKLGDEIDVTHALESLASFEEFGNKGYGTPKYFMGRSGPKSPVL